MPDKDVFTYAISTMHVSLTFTRCRFLNATFVVQPTRQVRHLGRHARPGTLGTPTAPTTQAPTPLGPLTPQISGVELDITTWINGGAMQARLEPKKPNLRVPKLKRSGVAGSLPGAGPPWVLISARLLHTVHLFFLVQHLKRLHLWVLEYKISGNLTVMGIFLAAISA